MGWLRKLFGRPPDVGPSLPGDSPEDWRAGDLAECVADGCWFNFLYGMGEGPKTGERYVVTDITISPCGQYLSFQRWGNHGFSATGFIKIQPRADEARAADAEFIRRLHSRELVRP